MRSYNKKLVKKRKGNTVTASGGAQGGGGASDKATSALDRSDKFAAALKAEAEVMVIGCMREGEAGREGEIEREEGENRREEREEGREKD